MIRLQQRSKNSKKKIHKHNIKTKDVIEEV
jgi:hypothetical protein